MPLTWLTRRIYLDSLQLPLILLSILLAVYYYNASKIEDKNNKRLVPGLNEFIDKRTLLIILSGITLGLAIFTKIPALAMIPVIAYLVIGPNKRYIEKVKALGLWFIPVILIPAIWPAYAISVDEYDNWYNGVFSQAGREGIGLASIQFLFKIDPFLVSIGVIGLIFAIFIKKDLFLLLWIVPFLAFHTVVPWTHHFHWLQILPAFCISGAVLINGIANMIGKINSARHESLDNYPQEEDTSSISFQRRVYGVMRELYNIYRNYKINNPSTTFLAIVATTILVFGMISTTMLITSNVNSSFFELVTFISQSLPEYREKSVNFDKEAKVKDFVCGVLLRLIGRSETRWIIKRKRPIKITRLPKWEPTGYLGLFGYPNMYMARTIVSRDFLLNSSVETEKVLIVADSRLLDAISSTNPEEHIKELKSLYDNSTTLEIFEENRPDYDENIYPYQSMSENRGIGKIEVRANY